LYVASIISQEVIFLSTITGGDGKCKRKTPSR
jgi:hypothetical protein